MPEPKLVVSLRENGIRVFYQEEKPVPVGYTIIIKVPPGVINGDYASLEIVLDMKGGQ